MKETTKEITNDKISLFKKIEDFKNNKLWIHISKEDAEYVKDLANVMPDVNFCSGQPLDSRAMNGALSSGEAWFRYEKGVSYNSENPRKSYCYTLSPWIYKHGPIVDIKDFLEIKPITIEDAELEELFNV